MTSRRAKKPTAWLAMPRRGPQENGLRRPEVFDQPYRPARRMFFMEKD